MSENICESKECVYYNENATENCMAPDYEDMLFAKCPFVTKRQLQPDPREAAIAELVEATSQLIDDLDNYYHTERVRALIESVRAALAAVGGGKC